MMNLRGMDFLYNLNLSPYNQNDRIKLKYFDDSNKLRNRLGLLTASHITQCG